MKITAHMIADRLGECLVTARILEGDSTRYDSVRMLLADENRLEAGLAYIADAKHLSTLTVSGQANLVICPLTDETDITCSALFCRGSINEIYDAVLAVFSTYNSLENELNEGLLEDWDLHRLLAPIARFLGNSVQVYAPIFKAIAGVKPDFGADDSVCGTSTYEQAITADIVHGMLRSSDLREDVKSGTAHYCRYPVFDCGCYQVNLLNNDKLIGRLVLIEEFRQFTQGVADTLDSLSKYIRHHMVHRRTTISSSLFTVEYSIKEILEGRIDDPRIIDTLLSAIAWPARDSFSILYFSFSTQDLPSKDLASFHMQALGDLMPHAIVLSIEEGIVALIRSKFLSPALFDDMLEPYLTTTEINAGLSEPFDDFHAARTSFLQAKAAVRLGTDSRAAGRIFRYKDNAVDHMVKIVIESGYGPTFIHPAIVLIADYDRENQTDLIATLRIYLETQGNQVASAQKLHIHRNSLKYRLQQLNEITGLDFRSTNQQLRLLLSILIRERL